MKKYEVNPQGFKRFAWMGFIAAVIFGSAKIIEGLLLGLIVVSGVFITINAVSFLKKFSMTKVGYPVMVIATAVLTHFLVGPGTLGGIIAVAFAINIKMFVLDAIRAWHRGEFTVLGRLLCGPLEYSPAYAC